MSGRKPEQAKEPPLAANADGADDDPALSRAAEKGDLACVQALLAARASTEAASNDGWRPLMYAAENGHCAVVDALLAARANVDAESNFGWTALRRAVEASHSSVVQALVVARASVDGVDQSGAPLQRALEKGDADSVQALLNARASVNVLDKKGSTFLHWAAWSGEHQFVQALIAAGAHTSVADKDGRTPLFLSASNGQLACVQALIAARSVVDTMDHKGSSPLFVSAACGHTTIVQALLAAKADANKPVVDGTTALQVAIERTHAETALALIEGGAITDTLTCLDLSGLGLNTLPSALSCATNLQQLNLVGNPLRTIPESVVQEGVSSVLAYLAEIHRSGRVPWRKAKVSPNCNRFLAILSRSAHFPCVASRYFGWRNRHKSNFFCSLLRVPLQLTRHQIVKVMVLGREGVGKTHLLRRMRGEKYEQNLSTNGISVEEVELSDMELTWFDLGGQEVFYATHQFFLTAQCVYLVLFRLDDAQYLERVQYWLLTISQFVRDPKVTLRRFFLPCQKIDNCP
jgi:ankyrin repeat protein